MNISDKEREILKVLVECKTQREMAKKMCMSLRLFVYKLQELKEKTGCESNHKLIAFAYDNEIIQKNAQLRNDVDPSYN